MCGVCNNDTIGDFRVLKFVIILLQLVSFWLTQVSTSSSFCCYSQSSQLVFFMVKTSLKLVIIFAVLHLHDWHIHYGDFRVNTSLKFVDAV